MKAFSLKYFFTGIALFLLMFLGAIICIVGKANSGFSAVLWLPTGISFTALYLLGLQYWPFLLLGEIVAYCSEHYPLFNIFIGPTAGIIVNYIIVKQLKKKLGQEVVFSRLQDLFTFLLIAVIIGPFLGSFATIFLFYIGGAIPSDKLFETWRAWWFSQGMGTLIVTGFFFHWVNDRKHRNPLLKARAIEAIFIFSLIILTSLLIFTSLSNYNRSLLFKPYFLYTCVLWASLRFDLFGATFTAIIMALTAVAGEIGGFVAFSTSNIDPSDRLILLQFMIAAISFTGLVVAATVREKSEALDAKNEFLDIASHELKTPITSLKLQLQLLQKRLDKKPEITAADLEQKTFLTKVDRQVNRLVRIVEQLLDVSRAERRIMELDLEEISLNELISQLTERLAGDLQNAKCTLKLNIPTEIKGMWDPFRLEQVLENLLSNAIKYAPGQAIEVSAQVKNNRVELSVRDYGHGIDATKQSTIFDRFVRASEVRHVQGLGLGLFITRRIIEAHGGTIVVDGTLKNGAQFNISLPLKTEL
jgi:signal transduction histidine kinase